MGLAGDLGGFVLAAALLVGFVLTERRVAHPMLRGSLLRSRQRVGGLLVISLIVGGQMSVFFLTVQYLQRELDFGPLSAGASIVPMTAGIWRCRAWWHGCWPGSATRP